MYTTTSTATSSRPRRLGARLAAVTVAAGALLAVPGVAFAHVTIQPSSIEGGGFSVVSVRVPNERDDASTTKVRVILPADQPLGSVQTTPVPGWRVTTAQRKLDKPLDFFGSKLTSVVSQVTWTATNGGVRPGQFQDFALSLGQLPESGDLTFKAIQTYSSGETVNWNEVAVDDSVEPEHPAPVLTLTAPKTDPAAADAADTSTVDTQDTAGTTTAAASTDEGSSSTLPVVLSAGALVVALGALLLAWRRRA
jgi:periplasmic copper chaperone A